MESIKEVFDIRLCREYLGFKESMLRRDRTELFAACWQIDVYRNLYEIMLEISGRMTESQLEVLYWQGNILERLYHSWIKADDGCYRELKKHVESEILLYGTQGKGRCRDGRDKECEASGGGRD